MSEQPMPVPGGVPVEPIARALFNDMLTERTAKGIATYGMALTTENGRDVYRDALEEAIDLWQYLTQARIEAADRDRERLPLENLARAAIAEAGTYRIPGACPCPVCEAVRALPGELRERLGKDGGE